MKTENGSIPMRDGKPEITNEMKAECMGEFSMEVEHTCSACSLNAGGDDVECEVCNGDIHYTRSYTIPWDTVKAIYKRMATVAMRHGDHS